MEYLKAFIIGGLICAIGQILIDYTKLTAARILVMFVITGLILGGLGWYKPFIDWAGAGAVVPITGFGSALAKGVKQAIEQKGPLGILTGGITGTAAGISAAMFFGMIAAVLSKPGEK
ncbi:MAG: stage V sporulation protein AE [Oscillospiraceae bacterium]|nr:stage V sporulation protein AE [Oscillospiraceae bacterium]